MIFIKTAVMIFVLLQCFLINSHAAEKGDRELLNIIKACVDIGDYDAESVSTDELMRRALYTYRNFEILTDIPSKSPNLENIKTCRTDFVKDAMYKAFRIDAPMPSPDMLTSLGYCESNGLYYFVGGNGEYFANDVQEIVKIIPLDDNTLYVIFSDYFTDGGNPPKLMYNSMRIGIDENGYYVISINIDDDFTALNSLLYLKDTSDDFSSIPSALPCVVLILTVIFAGVAFYIFFLRN